MKKTIVKKVGFILFCLISLLIVANICITSIRMTTAEATSRQMVEEALGFLVRHSQAEPIGKEVIIPAILDDKDRNIDFLNNSASAMRDKICENKKSLQRLLYGGPTDREMAEYKDFILTSPRLTQWFFNIVLSISEDSQKSAINNYKCDKEHVTIYYNNYRCSFSTTGVLNMEDMRQFCENWLGVPKSQKAYPLTYQTVEPQSILFY